MAEGFSRSLAMTTACLGLSLIREVNAGEYCFDYNRYIDYCETGCCGPYHDEYCCGMNVALIVGCVIGGLLCVAVIVTVVCCVMKKQGYRGRVAGPMTGNNLTVVNSNHHQTMGGYPAGQPPPPLMGGYSQPGYYGPPGGVHQYPPPPPYVYTNPAYPPPPQIATTGAPPGGAAVTRGAGFAAPAAPGYFPSTAAP